MADQKEAVYTRPGTVASDKAPWMSWDDEMDDGISAELAAEIDEYAKNRYEEDQSSSETKELLAMMREQNDENAEEYQWLKKADFANEEERTGRVLHSSEFITRLRRAGVTCFYKQHIHIDKAILIVTKGQVEEVGCWVQQGNMPELSFMHFDEHNVPGAEKRRGWRTCLLQLILKGFITEKKAIKYFGHPKQTATFNRQSGYNQLLYAFRNRNVEQI
jgi:hypothetical protein